MLLTYFLSDPGIPGPIYGSGLSNYVRPRRFADLTDVTLVDEDTNSIPTNKVNTLRGSPQSLSLCKYVQISNYISNRLVLKYSPCKDHEKCISRYTFFMVTDSVNRGIFNPMPYQSISIMKITMNPIDT